MYPSGRIPIDALFIFHHVRIRCALYLSSPLFIVLLLLYTLSLTLSYIFKTKAGLSALSDLKYEATAECFII